MLPIRRAEWDVLWARVPNAPLVQSWEYGEAKRQTQHCSAHRFLLLDEKAEPVGLLQALVYSLPLIGSVARINRGPVFFLNFIHAEPSVEDVREVMTAIQETAKLNRWRLLRIAPELLDNDDLSAQLSKTGFRKRTNASWASAIVDISRSAEDIRAGFHGKWRNLLNKSEKMDLELEIPPVENGLPFLIREYEKMQRNKSFKGLSTKLLRRMSEQEGPAWNYRLLFARRDGQRHGAVIVVGHGDTCTYLIGWTSPEGRRLQANYFLLWQAMSLFRKMGYSFFDVGGLAGITTHGVEHFKKRLQGEEYSLIGEYAYSSLPFL